MNCKKCGILVSNDSSYCPNCGQKIDKINNVDESLNEKNKQQVNVSQDISINKNKEKLSNISLIIGIVSIILAFFLGILILPLAITGLVLGITNNTKGRKKTVGIILNTLSISIITIMIICTFIFDSSLSKVLDYISSDNYIVGKYNCTGADNNTNKYLITLNLNNDNTFLYGPYDHLDNNYVKGTYTYEEENKTDPTGKYKYYMLEMKGNRLNYIIDGNIADHDFYSKMEFGITKQETKKQGVLIFTNTYKMYYCYEQK